MDYRRIMVFIIIAVFYINLGATIFALFRILFPFLEILKKYSEQSFGRYHLRLILNVRENKKNTFEINL